MTTDARTVKQLRDTLLAVQNMYARLETLDAKLREQAEQIKRELCKRKDLEDAVTFVLDPEMAYYAMTVHDLMSIFKISTRVLEWAAGETDYLAQLLVEGEKFVGRTYDERLSKRVVKKEKDGRNR